MTEKIKIGKQLLNLISTPAFILLMLMGIMLYLRIVPFYKIVFTDWPWVHGHYVNFAKDDAVYHMRLVHNTLQHFPWRIFFDPFTHFPYGSQIHFGPLFTLLIAGITFILSFGHPSPELANIVGAYLPPILAALCIIPVYFVAKNIFGKNAALLSAVIFALLPGEFFQRSTLGFTDHHVAEVLFSSLVFAFLSYAISTAKKIDRHLFIYGSLAGISFSLYLLTWPAAILVGAILFLFFLTQLVINYWQKHPQNIAKGFAPHNSENKVIVYCKDLTPLVLATIIYSIAIIAVWPLALSNFHLQLGYYSLTQPIVLAWFLAILWLVYLLSQFVMRYKMKRWLYPILLLAVSTIGIVLMCIFMPKLCDLIVSGIKLLFAPKRSMFTVAEVWPSIVDKNTGDITFTTLHSNFFWAFPMSIIALAVLVEKIFRRNSPNELLLFIWSASMLLATFFQSRFAYYYAVNAAILAGFLLQEIFIYFGEIFHTDHVFKNSKLRMAFFGLFLLIVTISIVYPIFWAQKHVLPYGPRLTREWYDTLVWLRTHTPDPEGEMPSKEFAYSDGQYQIPKKPDVKYHYPNSAYAIMNWWDIGHQITYVAKRIPIANPFQKGIVDDNDNNLGAAPFFTAKDEMTAVKILDATGSKYVLINNDAASFQYNAMLSWEGIHDRRVNYRAIKIGPKNTRKPFYIPIDSHWFHNSMLNKLYYLDGDHLSHFRLIYESTGNYIINAKSINVDSGIIDYCFKLANSNYEKLRQLALKAKYPHWFDAKKKTCIYDARMPVKSAKIFEKVTGATILGDANDDAIINLTIILLTNSGRLFVYSQNTFANHGHYQFIVPYPTEPMQGLNYNYAVIPLTDYIIKIDTHRRPIKVKVTEAEVKYGGKIFAN